MPAREDTYQKVMTALQQLARRGAAITVKTVAQQAGIARATLYNDALLWELVQRYERQQHFESGYAEGHRAGQKSSAPSRQSASEEWACGILYITPGETLTASLLKHRRAQLSYFFHPDKGGDTELQQTLNQAFDILKGKAA
jgi:hypothetical protein